MINSREEDDQVLVGEGILAKFDLPPALNYITTCLSFKASSLLSLELRQH